MNIHITIIIDKRPSIKKINKIVINLRRELGDMGVVGGKKGNEEGDTIAF